MPRESPALAVTFDPHPVALLRPDKAPVPLVWPEREIAILEEAGARPRLPCSRRAGGCSSLPPRGFFDRVIRRQFGARGMVEGPNFAFGHDREGDVALLGQWCFSAGIGFEVVDPIEGRRQADLFLSHSRGAARRECARGIAVAGPSTQDQGNRYPRPGRGAGAGHPDHQS